MIKSALVLILTLASVTVALQGINARHKNNSQ
jgi:hypothetical protein